MYVHQDSEAKGGGRGPVTPPGRKRYGFPCPILARPAGIEQAPANTDVMLRCILYALTQCLARETPALVPLQQSLMPCCLGSSGCLTYTHTESSTFSRRKPEEKESVCNAGGVGLYQLWRGPGSPPARITLRENCGVLFGVFFASSLFFFPP